MIERYAGNYDISFQTSDEVGKYFYFLEYSKWVL